MTIRALCKAVGISRQAFYKARKARTRREVDEEAIVELVKQERRLQPSLGGRKLFRFLNREMKELGIRIGRDRFFEVLRCKGLLVPQKRRRGPRTTDSRHGFRKYPNLLKEMELTGPNQAWVSDLTYVRTEEGFMYVSLIMDAWSRMVVGYCAAETLEAIGSMKALEMAMRQLPADASPIHHSDRGIQYCCWDYIEHLKRHGIGISMTEENHCYENAKAERLNGILKSEYGLGETLRTKEQARQALQQAVWLYNTRRPHTSLGYRTPEVAHREAA